MFSLLLKPFLLWRLNVLSVPFTASGVHLNLLLLPEVCHVLTTLGFAELSDVPLGSGGSPSIAYWSSLVATELGFLYPLGRDRDIFTFHLSSLDPEEGSVQASLCVSIIRVIWLPLWGQVPAPDGQPVSQIGVDILLLR